MENNIFVNIYNDSLINDVWKQHNNSKNDKHPTVFTGEKS